MGIPKDLINGKILQGILAFKFKWSKWLKGQYHAIFSNTLKVEKTLFG